MAMLDLWGGQHGVLLTVCFLKDPMISLKNTYEYICIYMWKVTHVATLLWLASYHVTPCDLQHPRSTNRLEASRVEAAGIPVDRVLAPSKRCFAAGLFAACWQGQLWTIWIWWSAFTVFCWRLHLLAGLETTSSCGANNVFRECYSLSHICLYIYIYIWIYLYI